uniref:Protein unc-80 n=1 Tax=Sipha flava TaxID=143950 RepID=A0A2S2Q2N9_9HEMI
MDSNPLNWNDLTAANDLPVPVNLQNFFWGLTSAFIRPKVGKLHENSCLFCQHTAGHHEMKEACKTFERLLVLDSQIDLPQNVKDEIKTFPRWNLIQASLPHIIHSTAAILQNRKGTNIQYIGPIEAKLLLILHWIIQDAPDECADSDYEKGTFQTLPHYYLFNIPTMTLFVYLIAPLINQVKESDLISNGLESGMKMWQAFWDNRTPSIACFSAHCKPKPKSLWYNLKRLSQEKLRSQEYNGRTISASVSSPHSINHNESYSQSKSFDDEIWIASPKDKCFPETIPEESSSTEDEQVVIFHIPPYEEYINNPENLQNNYQGKPSIFQLPVGKSDSIYTYEDLAAITSPEMKQLQNKIKIGNSKKKISGANNYNSSSFLTEESVSVDLNAATYLDVAVLRCLFTQQWCEEGVYWAFQFLYHRLQSINENIKIKQEPRRRSNSLPIPKIEVSFHHEPDFRGKIVKPNYSSTYDMGDSSPEIMKDSKRRFFEDRDITNVHSRQASERIKKKKKIVDLKAFVECKLLSKSEKNLQKFDYINDVMMLEPQCHNGFTNEELPNPLIKKLELLFQNNKTGFLNRGKSLPSLRVNDIKHVKHFLNPIITITEHSGVTSPDINFYKAKFFDDFQFDNVFPQGQKLSKDFRQSNLTRSQTDSNITYISEEIPEVQGSTNYITKDGDVNFEVVLRAIHFSVYQINTCKTFRTCEMVINLIELLLDLGILHQSWHREVPKVPNPNTQNTNSDYSAHLSYSKPMSPHALAMSSIIKIIQYLGCPHTCGEGHRGPPANFVRTQCQCLLNRLKQYDKREFSNYLRHFIKNNSLPCIINFIHSYIGFCTEPMSIFSPMCNKRKSLDTISQMSGSPSGYGPLVCNKGNEYHVVNVIFRSLMSKVVNSYKELKQPENTDIYNTLRFLIGYIKDTHPSVFKRVMLSGLIDTANRNNEKHCNIQTTRVIRHIPIHDHEEHSKSITEPFVLDKTSRKLLFKKRSTTTSYSNAFENQISEDIRNQMSLINLKRRRNPMLVSKPSEGSMQCSKKSYSNRLQIKEIVNWISSKSNVHECRGRSQGMNSSYDSSSDVGSLVRQAANLHQSYCRGSKKTNSGMSQKFKKTKKRMGHHLNKYVFRKGRKKDKNTEDSQGSYLSRRDSLEDGDHPHQSEFVVLKERKLVEIKHLRAGIQRFSAMMEICGPGSVPDANLISAAFDLPNTPVLARAVFLLECCHFVHCCNKGQWSTWMKMTRPSGLNFKPTVISGTKKSVVVQHNAGKLFRQWGEIIAARLDEMISEDKKQLPHILACINDEALQRELQTEDEEEDFLDETSGLSRMFSCPMVLRLIACMLFLEITSYLRETYRSLPKTRPSNPYTTLPISSSAWERERQSHSREGRRWSMALSSMGHSQASAQSLQSISGEKEQAPADKGKTCMKRNDGESGQSNENSNPNVHFNQCDETGSSVNIDDKKNKGSNQSSAHPLAQRKSMAGSIKRYSLKLRRNTKEGIKEMMSSDGDYRSDTSDGCAPTVPGEASGEDESAAMMSDDHAPISPCESNETDDTTYFMPWLKTVIEINKSFDHSCTHQSFCHPLCYKRQMRSCSRLIKAIRKLYGEEFGLMASIEKNGDPDDINTVTKVDIKKYLQIPSCQSSPNKRKDSLGRIETSNLLYNLGESLLATKKRLFGSKSKIHEKKENKNKNKEKDDPPVILKYIKNQVHDIFHCSMALLIKAAVVLTEEQVLDILPIAWEFLLDSNQELVASSSTLFIIAAFKAPQKCIELISSSLTNKDSTIRANAILKYHVLWKNRFQPWPRMEEGAHSSFRIPPPSIEFTLTSPKIGIECLPIVDPPWMPQVETKVEEVTIGQDTHRSLVTATKTRKKQQTELIKMALEAKEDQRRNERESFLITAIPINSQAAHESSMHHGSSDPEYEEGVEIDEHENPLRVAHHSVQSVTALFPSALCSAVIEIISLLNDPAVTADGSSVCETAYQVIWDCLVEDCNLFLRFVLERLTRDNQEKMFKLLRHLIRFVPKLPHQAAFILYNYIIGYVMFYVRSPHEEGQIMIGSALSILWMVVHSVHGIMFKDLKQILRKEQCDGSILLTANVPSTKKVVVHGPQEQMSGGIPSQFPVQEDTQFFQILKESLDFFGIPEERHKEFFLVNIKTRQIHNPTSYVRDYYFFKRSQYPQLELIQMDLIEAFNQLQSQELIHKFIEIGKVLLTWAILKNVDMVVQRVVFLHEELIKLPSFPRKALDADLDLYQGGNMGKELLGLDLLHKFTWVRLLARMFEAMAGNFAYSGDIHLFLNVLNGAVTLHSEDSCVLRYVMATYINAARNFKNIFSSNGYLLIIPTLLQLYASHHTNKIVTRSIEYTIKQFYLMNRKPFILQMFGSASSILDLDDVTNFEDSSRVEANYFFKLILSLETASPDPIHISELIKEEKPLQAVDFCYQDEDDTITIQDCISLCVMVISFSPETLRSYQMLLILEAILPCYLKHIQQPNYRDIERDVISQLIISIKTLINNSEALSKHYNGPQKTSQEPKDSSGRNCSKGLCSPTGGETRELESNSKMFSERKVHKSPFDKEFMDFELQVEEKYAALRNEFRRTRDVLLSVVTDFFVICHARLTELSRKYPQEGKPFEILDTRMQIRLGEVAHSLLKVSPYDPETMSCKGLLKYMTNILPVVDWAAEALRPTLLGILRRLDKTFNKIYKKPSIRRYTDWYAAGELIKGVYEILSEHPFIVHIPHFKALISTCQGIIVGDSGSTITAVVDNFQQSNIPIEMPPPHFCAIVIRLLALHILAIGDNYTLEQSVGGMANIMSSQVKTEGFLMNLFLPLCFRVGIGKKDMHCMRPCDIKFMLLVVLNSMSPPVKTTCLTFVQLTNVKQTSDLRTNSYTFNRDSKPTPTVSKSFFKVLFLALKIMLVCFESELALQFQRIAHTVKELMNVPDARASIWSFIEFVITNRSPLFILLQPFILQRLTLTNVTEQELAAQNSIKEKHMNYTAITPLCRSSLLVELMNEMTELKQELDDRLDEQRIRSSNGVRNSCETQHRPSIINLLPGNSNPSYSVCTINTHRESISSVRSNLSSQESSIKTLGNIPREQKNADGEQTDFSNKHNEPRLQRSRAQSRKIFRFRQSRRMEVIPQGGKLQQHQQDDEAAYDCSSARPQDDGRTVTVMLPKPEMIWEEDSHSAPSRTSSTSGYRENCSLLMMPMGSSDENSSSSPVHRCLTNSSSTIMPIESPESLAMAGDDMMGYNGYDIGSQQTIVTFEQEDTLL